MLRFVLFDLELFPDEASRKSSQERVLWLLQALTNGNRIYLRDNPDTPLIYKSKIKYKAPQQFEPAQVPEIDLIRGFLESHDADPKQMKALDSLHKMCGGGEQFRDIPRIIANGGGDCDNVSCWRAAELAELGISARPYITWRQRPDGGTTYHVIVRWPDGTSEDPSLLLGMGGEERAADRAEEVRKLGERTLDFAKGAARKKQAILGAAITTPQDFSHVQYSIPFQTDDAYEDWSPTRPQAFYFDPRYPNLTSTTPEFLHTRIRDVDSLEDDFDDRLDRFDGHARAFDRRRARALTRRAA